MKYILRQVLPPDRQEEPIEIHLTEDEVQVGRKSKVVLTKFPQISRHHATFYRSENDNLFVKDQGSLNGLFVNDEKIGSSLKPLKIGDVIGFGVMRDQVSVGFVCVVSCDEPPLKIKHEVIELSDDDDNTLSHNAPNSIPKSNPSHIPNFTEKGTCSPRLPNATFSNSDNSHVPCSSSNIQNNSSKPSSSKSKENSDIPSSMKSKFNFSAPISSVVNELIIQDSNANSPISHISNTMPNKNKHPKVVNLHFSKNSSHETRLPNLLDIPSDNIETDTLKQGITSSSAAPHSTHKDQRENSSSKISKRLSSDDITTDNYATSNKVQNKTSAYSCMSNSENLSVPSNNSSNLSSKSSSKDTYFRTTSGINVSTFSVNNELHNSKQDSVVNNRTSNLSSKGDLIRGSSSRIPESSFHSSGQNSYKSSSSNVTDRISYPVTTNSDSVGNPLDSKVQKSVQEGKKLLKSSDALDLPQISSKTPVSKKIKAECTSDFQNDSSVHSIGHSNIKKNELIRTCYIPLIRCDSKYFPWPEGIKNPFRKKYKKSSVDRIQKIPEHASELTGLFKNRNSSNISTDNHSNTKHNNLSKQDGKHKRKCSFESNVEVPDNMPSTSKKFCFENEYRKRTVSDDHEKCMSKNALRSESESDNEMNYSQVEDVIYISDDEEDFNLKSQQNYVHIKKEPIDDYEDDDIYILADIEAAASSHVFSNLVEIKQEKIDMEAEIMEPISAFVSEDEQKQVEQCDDVSAENTNIKEKVNQLSPVHPQNFEIDIDKGNKNSDIDDSEEDRNNSEVADNSEDDSSSSEEDVNYKLKSYEDNLHPKQNTQKPSKNCSISNKNNEKFEMEHQSVDSKNRTKSKAKIQLIDAKPMEYRPRYMRGRDEGFVERKQLATTSHNTERKKSTSSSRNSKKSKGSPIKELLKNKGPFFSNPNLNNFKIPRKQNSDKSSHSPQKERTDKRPRENSDFRKSHESAKRPSSVKRRPEKATSRMGFLFNEVKINPRSRAVTNLETSKKVEVIHAANKALNPSDNSSKASESQKSKVPSSSHKVGTALDTSNKIPVVYNPRDPRQNRIPSSSSETLNNNSVVTKFPPATKSVKFALNNKASDTVLPSVHSSADTNQLRHKLINDLIHLNTKWLQEQNKVKRPPDAVCAGVDKLPLKYESYESYVSLFYPMIKLEIWEQMFTESKEISESKNAYKSFLFSILSYTSKNNYIELVCESVVNGKFSKYIPVEGSIIQLDLKDTSKRHYPQFGYVYRHRFESLNWNSLKLPAQRWKSYLPEECHKNARHLTFHAHIKKKDICFALESVMRGNLLCSIRNKMRLIDTLTILKNSPLLTDILQPRWQTFLVKYSSASPSREYNSGQMEVINSVSTEISKSNYKIILIQGPPGTGKTHTIIGLMNRLLSSKQYHLSYKILVVAPSNAAIDEIGCRLIDFNEKNKSKASIQFVRIGMEDQIHVRVKPYSLDRIAKKLQSNAMLREKEKELNHLKAEIARVDKDVYNKDRNETLKYLQERYKHLSEQYVKPYDYSTDMMQKINLLKNCHIVLSTLSCCGIPIMLKTFATSSDAQFSCCIVDESTQCTEVEVLQPLLLSVKKFILVGDHKQLPATVLSKTACKYGHERSVFERFHYYFDHYVRKTPMYTLTEQFRMHSEICKFPSRFIYDHKLITNPNTDVSYKDFPLIPYMMLDVYVSQEENDSSSKINSTEAKVIISICTLLLDIVDSASSIGIITPYQAQRSLYMDALKINPLYKDIEVNTVDGFQGREKDIIIVSSVRANSHSGSIGFLACKRRLNVAITRAKKCLIVCGHADSLVNNQDWRELILDAKKREVCFHVKNPGDIPLIFKLYMRKQKVLH